MSYEKFAEGVSALAKKYGLRVRVYMDSEKVRFIGRFSDGTKVIGSPSCLRVEWQKGNFRSIGQFPA